MSSLLMQLLPATSSAHIQTCASEHAHARARAHTYARTYTCKYTSCCTPHLTHADAGLYGFSKARKQGCAH